jgi:hypothetical protein
MLISFLFRTLLKHKKLLLSVSLLVAMALAAISSSMYVAKVLENNRPIGTQYQGQAVSFFAQVSQMGINFLLSPQQILTIQAQIELEADIIASSQVLQRKIKLSNKEVLAAVEATSTNYFAVLNVNGADNNKFNDKNTAYAAISQVFSEQHQLKMGDSVSIKNKIFVIGFIVEDYQGLYDRKVDIWLPWHFAHSILFSVADEGLAQQPWGYWATIISKAHTSPKRFENLLEQLIKREDLLVPKFAPPVDKLGYIHGVTYDQNIARTAQTSARNYVTVSGFILAIAILCSITFSIMVIRASASSFQLFLTLGISSVKFYLVNTVLITAPVLLGGLISIPINNVFLTLLESDPAIAMLLANNTATNAGQFVTINMACLFITLLVVMLTTYLLLKKSASHYSAESIYQAKKFSSAPFYFITFCAVVITNMCLIIAIAIIEYSYPIIQTLENKNIKELSVYLPSDRKNQDSLLSDVTTIISNNYPDNEIAFTQYIPMTSFVKMEPYFNAPYQGKPYQAGLNNVSANAFDLLGVKVLVGDIAKLEIDNNYIAIDTKFVAMQGYSNNNEALGVTLYDKFGDAREVTAVVEKISYHADPEASPPMVYGIAKNVSDAPQILIKSAMSDMLVNRFIHETLAGLGLHYEFHTKLAEIQQEQIKPIYNRLLLCVLITFTGIFSACINLFAIAKLLQTHKLRALSIYHMLGASYAKGYLYLAKHMLMVTVVASFISVQLMSSYTSFFIVWPLSTAFQYYKWLSPIVVMAVLMLIIFKLYLTLYRSESITLASLSRGAD